MGCTCYAHGGPHGSQVLKCKDEYNNLVPLEGCCSGRGSAGGEPVMEMCHGMSCSRLENDGTHCFDNVVRTPDNPKRDPIKFKSNPVKDFKKITESKLKRIIKNVINETQLLLERPCGSSGHAHCGQSSTLCCNGPEHPVRFKDMCYYDPRYGEMCGDACHYMRGPYEGIPCRGKTTPSSNDVKIRR